MRYVVCEAGDRACRDTLVIDLAIAVRGTEHEVSIDEGIVIGRRGPRHRRLSITCGGTHSSGRRGSSPAGSAYGDVVERVISDVFELATDVDVAGRVDSNHAGSLIFVESVGCK